MFSSELLSCLRDTFVFFITLPFCSFYRACEEDELHQHLLIEEQVLQTSAESVDCDDVVEVVIAPSEGQVFEPCPQSQKMMETATVNGATKNESTTFGILLDGIENDHVELRRSTVAIDPIVESVLESIISRGTNSIAEDTCDEIDFQDPGMENRLAKLLSEFNAPLSPRSTLQDSPIEALIAVSSNSQSNNFAPCAIDDDALAVEMESKLDDSDTIPVPSRSDAIDSCLDLTVQSIDNGNKCDSMVNITESAEMFESKLDEEFFESKQDEELLESKLDEEFFESKQDEAVLESKTCDAVFNYNENDLVIESKDDSEVHVVEERKLQPAGCSQNSDYTTMQQLASQPKPQVSIASIKVKKTIVPSSNVDSGKTNTVPNGAWWNKEVVSFDFNYDKLDSKDSLHERDARDISTWELATGIAEDRMVRAEYFRERMEQSQGVLNIPLVVKVNQSSISIIAVGRPSSWVPTVLESVRGKQLRLVSMYFDRDDALSGASMSSCAPKFVESNYSAECTLMLWEPPLIDVPPDVQSHWQSINSTHPLEEDVILLCEEPKVPDAPSDVHSHWQSAKPTFPLEEDAILLGKEQAETDTKVAMPVLNESSDKLESDDDEFIVWEPSSEMKAAVAQTVAARADQVEPTPSFEEDFVIVSEPPNANKNDEEQSSKSKREELYAELFGSKESKHPQIPQKVDRFTRLKRRIRASLNFNTMFEQEYGRAVPRKPSNAGRELYKITYFNGNTPCETIPEVPEVNFGRTDQIGNQINDKDVATNPEVDETDLESESRDCVPIPNTDSEFEMINHEDCPLPVESLKDKGFVLLNKANIPPTIRDSTRPKARRTVKHVERRRKPTGKPPIQLTNSRHEPFTMEELWKRRQQRRENWKAHREQLGDIVNK